MGRLLCTLTSHDGVCFTTTRVFSIGSTDFDSTFRTGGPFTFMHVLTTASMSTAGISVISTDVSTSMIPYSLAVTTP